MKKFFFLFSLLAMSVALSGGEMEWVAEERGRALCEFASDFFLILHNEDEGEEKLVERLRPYTVEGKDLVIRHIVSRLIDAIDHAKVRPCDAKEEAVSHLGRVIKSSVDVEVPTRSTPCILHKTDLLASIRSIEHLLNEDLSGKSTDYHKLMFESLADRRYDIALYAYLKIAENLCRE